MYDLRGHGRSEPPATGYRLEDTSTTCRACSTRWEHRPVHLVGNSYGGTVAFGWRPASRPGRERHRDRGRTAGRGLVRATRRGALAGQTMAGDRRGYRLIAEARGRHDSPAVQSRQQVVAGTRSPRTSSSAGTIDAGLADATVSGAGPLRRRIRADGAGRPSPSPRWRTAASSYSPGKGIGADRADGRGARHTSSTGSGRSHWWRPSS